MPICISCCPVSQAPHVKEAALMICVAYREGASRCRRALRTLQLAEKLAFLSPTCVRKCVPISTWVIIRYRPTALRNRLSVSKDFEGSSASANTHGAKPAVPSLFPRAFLHKSWPDPRHPDVPTNAAEVLPLEVWIAPKKPQRSRLGKLLGSLLNCTPGTGFAQYADNPRRQHGPNTGHRSESPQSTTATPFCCHHSLDDALCCSQ